jgi:hypothetical protein
VVSGRLFGGLPRLLNGFSLAVAYAEVHAPASRTSSSSQYTMPPPNNYSSYMNFCILCDCAALLI